MKVTLIFVLALAALASAETEPTDSTTATTPTTTATSATTTATTTTPTTTATSATTTTPTTTATSATTTTPTTTATSATTTATSATTTATSATTTATSATTTATTATTTAGSSTPSTTTAKPVTVTVQPQVVAIFNVEITNANGQVTHKATQMCSGTIVSSRSVLTTATCATSATSKTGLPIRILTNKYNSTVLAGIPISDYYEVMKVELNPDYVAATGLRNQAILKFDMDLDTENGVSWMGWVENPVAVNTQCIASFWTTNAPFTQWNQQAQIVACPAPANDWQICADITPPTSTKVCKGGEDGTSLICNGRVAGLLSATTTASCDIMKAKPFNELSADKPFLYNTVNAAPLVHFSATAFLAMVLVVIRNYC